AIAGTPVMALDGFPSWEEAAMRYQEKSGRDLSGLDFYAVLAHFKLGVILENMHRRFLAGGTVGPGFEMIGQNAQLLGQRGLTIADAWGVNELLMAGIPESLRHAVSPQHPAQLPAACRAGGGDDDQLEGRPGLCRGRERAQRNELRG